MHPLLNIAISAARSASKVILRYMDKQSAGVVDEKASNDFVTEVDRRSEEVIIDTIRKAYPHHSILAEESGYSSGDDYCWIIDPLDGTTNFMHGFPQFSISIAVKKANTLEIGVVYDPVRNELFTASRGQGAHMNNHRLRVSEVKRLEHALIGTGFPIRDLDLLTDYLKTFENVMRNTSGIRRAGSAALDLAYVAAGRFDGFWESTLKSWDIAAGALLIKEAGGMISDFQGEDNYLDTGSIIAGNPKIFKAMQELVMTSA